jgi:hypothetical protein
LADPGCSAGIRAGEQQRDEGEEREGREGGAQPVQARLLVLGQDRLGDLLAHACLGERLLQVGVGTA